jgi:hypothetical protein
VPAEECVNGILKDQRPLGRFKKPDGTRTFYQTSTSRPSSNHAAEYENAFSTVVGANDTETVSNIDGGVEAWTFQTLADRLASSQWPTTGTYRIQLDITSISTNCEIGAKTLDGEAGHFARLTTHQTFEQSQSSFTTTGLHIASITDPSWSSGSIHDIFAVSLVANRVTGHSKESVTLRFGSDAWADGPWRSIDVAPLAVYF